MLSIVGLAGWAVLAADPVVVSKGVQQFNQVADMPQCHVVGKVPRGWQWHVGTWSWNPSAAFSISHIAKRFQHKGRLRTTLARCVQSDCVQRNAI